MFGGFNLSSSFTQFQGLNETLQKFKEEVEHNITDSVANRASTSLADGLKTFTGGLGGLQGLPGLQAKALATDMDGITVFDSASTSAAPAAESTLSAQLEATAIDTCGTAEGTPPADGSASVVVGDSHEPAVAINHTVHDLDSTVQPQVIGPEAASVPFTGHAHESLPASSSSVHHAGTESADGPTAEPHEAAQGWDLEDDGIGHISKDATGRQALEDADVAKHGDTTTSLDACSSAEILADTTPTDALQHETIAPGGGPAGPPCTDSSQQPRSPVPINTSQVEEAAHTAGRDAFAEVPAVPHVITAEEGGHRSETPCLAPVAGEEVEAAEEGSGAPEVGASAGTPPFSSVDSMDAPALRSLVSALQETLSAREDHLERSYSEMAQMRQATELINAKNQELARRCAKISEEDLEQMTQEFEDRLAAADRKVYALTKERDALRRGTDKLFSVNELLKAKDEMIKDVMEEGERLSKKQLQQESTIRKLKGQVKESEEEFRKIQKKLAKCESDTDALRRDKAALEMQLQCVIDRHRWDLEAERRQCQSLIEAANAARAEADARLAASVKKELHKKARDAEEQAAVLADTVEELRAALEQQRAEANSKEDLLQRELSALEQRCQEAEMRHGELSLRFPEATRPLVQQIEALQAAATAQRESWAITELNLTERVQDAEARAAAAAEKERIAIDRMQSAHSTAASHQAALEVARLESRDLLAELEAARSERVSTEHVVQQLQQKLQDMEQQQAHWMTEKKEVERMLEAQLDALQSQNATLTKRLRDIEEGAPGRMHKGALQPPALAAPGYKWILVPNNGSTNQRLHDKAHSTGSLLMGSTTNTSNTPTRHNDDEGSEVAVLAAAEDDVPSTHAEIQHTVQQLRMKEHTVNKLQDMVAQLEETRDKLSEDLIALTQRATAAENAAVEVDQIRREMAEMHARHLACMELLGEREEQVEELKADLEDLRTIMKEQVMYVVNTIENNGNSPLSSMRSSTLG